MNEISEFILNKKRRHGHTNEFLAKETGLPESYIIELPNKPMEWIPRPTNYLKLLRYIEKKYTDQTRPRKIYEKVRDCIHNSFKNWNEECCIRRSKLCKMLGIGRDDIKLISDYPVWEDEGTDENGNRWLYIGVLE